jgi:hypothetical protein
MKNVTTTTERVAKIGNPTPSKFEGKANRVAVTFEGRTNAVWLDEPEANRLQVGASCTLLFDGKTYAIADVSASPIPAAKPSPAPSQVQPYQGKMFEVPTKETRENIMKYIEWETNLYRHCYEEVVAVMGETKDGKKPDLGLDKYNIKDIATTIFLSVQRRYNLQ